MCDYCKEPHGQLLTDGLFEQCRIKCLHDVSNSKKRYVICINDSAYAKIKFCPMCGRELK